MARNGKVEEYSSICCKNIFAGKAKWCTEEDCTPARWRLPGQEANPSSLNSGFSRMKTICWGAFACTSFYFGWLRHTQAQSLPFLHYDSLRINIKWTRSAKRLVVGRRHCAAMIAGWTVRACHADFVSKALNSRLETKLRWRSLVTAISSVWQLPSCGSVCFRPVFGNTPAIFDHKNRWNQLIWGEGRKLRTDIDTILLYILSNVSKIACDPTLGNQNGMVGYVCEKLACGAVMRREAGKILIDQVIA